MRQLTKYSDPSSGGKIAPVAYHAKIHSSLPNLRPDLVVATIRLMGMDSLSFFSLLRQE
jgi:hypothetical protein